MAVNNEVEDDGADPEPGSGGRHQVQGVDHKAKVRELLDSIRPEMNAATASAPPADTGDSDGADPDPEIPPKPEAKRATVEADDDDDVGDPGDAGDAGDPGDADEPGAAEEKPKAAKDKKEMTPREKADQYFKRQREKAKRAERGQLQQQVVDLQRRLDEMATAKPPVEPKADTPAAATPAANPHDKADDPTAWFEWELNRTNAELADVRKRNADAEAADAARQQQQEQQAKQQTIINNYAKHVDDHLNPALKVIPGFGRMIDRVVDGLAATAAAQGVPPEVAQRNATITMLLIAKNAEEAEAGKPREYRNPNAIPEALFDYCERITGGVEYFQDAEQAEEQTTANGKGQQPDLAGARAAARRKAPGSINSQPGGRGPASPSTIQGMTKLRDRQMTLEQSKGIFETMRREAGLR